MFPEFYLEYYFSLLISLFSNNLAIRIHKMGGRIHQTYSVAFALVNNRANKSFRELKIGKMSFGALNYYSARITKQNRDGACFLFI